MGVRNAILTLVDEINSTDKEIQVYGPIIHNPQTLKVLEERGVKIIKNLDSIKSKNIAIRTHGVPIEEYREIKAKAFEVINLTCPRVAKVQAIIKKHAKEGYFTIIVGDKNHAEVLSLQSYAEKGYHIVSRIEDIETIPGAAKYVILSQTTIDREFFQEVVDILGHELPECVVIDTICDSTKRRQDDVLCGIEDGIDTLVVVGGKNSANTRRLAKIGLDHGIETIHIETESELKTDRFIHTKNLLVTAGASTPGWIINNVLEKLYEIKFKKSNFVLKSLKSLVEFFVRSNLLSSLSAFFMSILSQWYMSMEVDMTYGLIAFLFVFSMISINNYFDKEFLKNSNSYKYTVYAEIGFYLFIISLLSIAVSIILVLNYDLLTIMVCMISYIIGFLYSTIPVKKYTERINNLVLKKIYYSKITSSFGWILVAVVLPFLGNEYNVIPIIGLCSIFFAMVLLRQ